jgi:hypothetical protein
MMLYFCLMAKQESLFDADEFIDKGKLDAQQKEEHPYELPLLQVHKKATKEDSPIDKESRKFNKLLKELHDYEASLKDYEAAQEAERKLYQQKCLPELIKLANAKLLFLLKAERLFERNSFTKREQQHFCEFVQDFSRDVELINEDIAAMVLKYINLSMTLLSNKQRAKLKDQLFEDTDGLLDIDLEDFDSEDFAQKNYERFSEKNHSNDKDAALEEKHAADITNISLNDLYKTLAKELHPDLEKNDAIREVKVKLMQELSEAKNNKDLLAMLRIRQKALPYLKKEAAQHIFNLDRLKAFNKVLGEKLRVYRDQLKQRTFAKYYTDGNGYVQSKSATSVERIIDQQTKQIKNVTKAVKKDLDFIYDADNLKEYMSYYFLS